MPPAHLLVLTHGMWGNPGHVSELERFVNETHPEPALDGSVIKIFYPVANRNAATYDGIDWCGERVVDEVYEEVERLKQDGYEVTKFSITGYSLGGLVARFVVGKLRQDGFFERIKPMNFATIATPHFGIPQFRAVVSKVINAVTSRLLGRTGQQFCLRDDWHGTGRPLVEILADPKLVFYKALAAFENIALYANGVNDPTVPYVTAAIEPFDPFVDAATNGINIVMDDDHLPLIKSYKLPATPPPKPTILSPQWIEANRPLPILPPFLQFKFPYNIAVYSTLPLLLPLTIPVVLVRFASHSKKSERRLQVLEKSAKNRLTFRQIVDELEVSLDTTQTPGDLTMVDQTTVADDGETLEVHVTDQSSGKPTTVEFPVEEVLEVEAAPGQPILMPAQRRVITWLNVLPIKKRITYIPRVRNTHGIIVCRDAEQIEAHRAGEGVLRHWAAEFML